MLSSVAAKMEYSDYAAQGKSSLGQAPVQNNELDESYLSTSSFDAPHEQVFKSQGIKQLLSQAPASGLTTT